MELHEIRYFLAVGETRNFTKAADACHVTQPALTRAIRKLEDELGGMLVSRERGNIHLTDLGRLLEPSLRAMMVQAGEAKRTAESFLRLKGAPIRLGVMCTVGPVRFTGFLNEFRVSHPGIELTLIEGMSSELKELLRSGDLDVAVISDPEGFEPPLHASVLYQEPFILACGPTHAFAARTAITLEDLEGEIYLQRIHCEYRDRLAQMLAERGVTIRRAHRSEREDWIQSMVAAGMGVCFLPSFSATVPGLVQVRVVDPEVAREVCIVTIAQRHPSPPMAALLAALDAYAWTNDGESHDRTEPARPGAGEWARV
ncbi:MULTISPECIES: LysR family transcriptional regulator [Methylobacterium]|jgi:LysR family hydrogen peroxide-inducible transcriptional activator|uniref:Hydrogen peroxide-inducible genes activator n=1 Tax=Methylobacterium hispanicum TaxID=270350 RepID=A0AAV4ZMA9_9HYPH|nr:LysR family transcriptional regulator [Methylobacterium hispanicum]GJD89322.1 Hydrogen peroxide-inducible genes activator [Methylobacterium hispanicum]